MPKSNLPATNRFQKLVDDISHLYVNARKAQVQFAWETGRRIVQEEQDGALRAAYGARLVPKLSKALAVKHGPGFSVTTLKKMRQFYLRDPKGPISGHLEWSGHVELLPVKDEKIRKSLARRVLKENLNIQQLRRLVSRVRGNNARAAVKNEKPPVKQELLIPKRGMLYTYRMIQRPKLGGRVGDSPLQLDLGFGVFRDVEARSAARFSPDQIVESHKKDDTYMITSSERTAKDLFTYSAAIERVIDADTLKVRVDLGFGIWHRETLRLRDIDAPELGTRAGDAAKAFVQSLLKEAGTIILHTSRSDKYDRYLADVFLPADEATNGSDPIYLNNLLLEEGHAQRV